MGSAAGGPADQWDALPSAAKLQILVFIGFLEMWSETSTVLKLDGEAHYVRGGKPGYFPKLSRKDDAAFPHPVPLNLWDPFGFTSKMSPERKEKALLAEINNGRPSPEATLRSPSWPTCSRASARTGGRRLMRHSPGGGEGCAHCMECACDDGWVGLAVALTPRQPSIDF